MFARRIPSRCAHGPSALALVGRATVGLHRGGNGLAGRSSSRCSRCRSSCLAAENGGGRCFNDTLSYVYFRHLRENQKGRRAKSSADARRLRRYRADIIGVRGPSSREIAACRHSTPALRVSQASLFCSLDVPRLTDGSVECGPPRPLREPASTDDKSTCNRIWWRQSHCCALPMSGHRL
jgi:hypothetical protein